MINLLINYIDQLYDFYSVYCRRKIFPFVLYWGTIDKKVWKQEAREFVRWKVKMWYIITWQLLVQGVLFWEEQPFRWALLKEGVILNYLSLLDKISLEYIFRNEWFYPNDVTNPKVSTQDFPPMLNKKWFFCSKENNCNKWWKDNIKRAWQLKIKGICWGFPITITITVLAGSKWQGYLRWALVFLDFWRPWRKFYNAPHISLQIVLIFASTYRTLRYTMIKIN